MKIFKTNSKDIVIECKIYFGFRDVDELITQGSEPSLLLLMQMITVYVTFVNTSLIAFSTNTVI